MILFSNLSGEGYPEKKKKLIIDETLFEKIGKGDVKAFEELYRLTDKAIYAYILSILKDPFASEDVMQETYIKIRSAAHLYIPQKKPLAWMFTIAKNLCLMKLRENKRKSDSDYFDLENNVEFSYVTDAEDKIVLKSALTILSEEERNIILLYAVSGLKHTEIAKSLGIPISTELSKYHRGLKKLKKHLKEKEGF